MNLREYVAHYIVLVSDAARVMLRIKALFRGHAITTPGISVYGRHRRQHWLRRISATAPKRRLASLYYQLDMLAVLRDQARVDMITAALHAKFEILCTFPFVSSIRASQLLAYIGGARVFRRKANLWSYAGLAVVNRSSGDHRVEDGRVVDRPRAGRRLRRNFNPQLKRVLKDIALAGSIAKDGPLRRAFNASIERGLSERVARVALARRIASAVRGMLRDHVPFDPLKFISTTKVPDVGGQHP
jgi:transposase